MDAHDIDILVFDDTGHTEDPYFRIPSSPSWFFALDTLTPPSPSPSASSITSLDFDEYPIFLVDSVAQSPVESSPTLQCDLLGSPISDTESISSICSFGTFGPRAHAQLLGSVYGQPEPVIVGKEPTYLPCESPLLAAPSMDRFAQLFAPPVLKPVPHPQAIPRDFATSPKTSPLHTATGRSPPIPDLDPSNRHFVHGTDAHSVKHVHPTQGHKSAVKERRPMGGERKCAAAGIKDKGHSRGQQEPEFVWLHGISIDLLIDQEGFRSTTPSFKYSGVNRFERDKTACTVTFKATSKQGFQFHYNPFDSSPVLRRVTIHGEESKDYISKQAQLTLKANGVYSVHGAEISSLSPMHSRLFIQMGHDPEKLDWEFKYRVENRVDAYGRVIDGEKTFIPLTFTCSPWLLHPSQGKRVNLIHIFKKGVATKLTAEKFNPPPAPIPEISITSANPGSPGLVQDEFIAPLTGAKLHRRAWSHAVRDMHERQEVNVGSPLKGSSYANSNAQSHAAHFSFTLPSSTMSVTHVTSLSQLNGILSKSKDKLTVIDFHATWCGPCHAIAPKFESLAREYKNSNFVKCDVDAATDVASEYKVTAMPTFVLLKGSTKVDQVRGANASALEAAISKHASAGSSSSTASFSGKGQRLGGGPAPSDLTGEARRAVGNATEGVSGAWGNLDPQLRVFFGLLGLYALFWILG
ncbi:hypothetical protein EST38_g1815 [Candolleomyces aberdarensis]|uniref:Thioredoxin domain-containing protein n=1 Tax=Candolleomyces aberdarensis TaxID=2316362 RepID=A0A4Q2DYG2_9AGAR|nr:hypothetical protein EST38_g1815 [Candolleomyces aberdarensis]